MLKLTTGYLPTVPRRLHTVASTTKFTIQTERMATTEVSFNPEEINIKLDNVKNMRDLAAISDKILPNKVIRTGCVSKASTSDIKYIQEHVKFRSLIDLRSPAEWEEDEKLTSEIYSGFQDYHYEKRKRNFIVSDKIVNDSDPYKRFFISLMSESLIKKGVFMRLRKRLRLKAVGLYALSKFSRRANKKVRGMFIDRINTGGLALLNELVVDSSGREIVEVLKLIAEPKNHPIGVYCTAGKDRTGLIAMLVLHVLGASDREILADYALSDSAYKDLNDNKAMVASLKQVDVDPNTFLRANPEVMKATMEYIRNLFGSIDAFLDEYGFNESWREKLRNGLSPKNQ